MLLTYENTEIRKETRGIGFIDNILMIWQQSSKIRAEKTGKIILAGHSMGGGIALRYTMKSFPTVDGYLLFAPPQGKMLQTIPQNRTAKQSDGDPFLKIHIQRIIGLKMQFNW